MAWSVFAVDTRGSRGAYCALADLGGKPGVAYYVLEATGKLKFAHAQSAAPSGDVWDWNISLVDELPDVPILDADVAAQSLQLGFEFAILEADPTGDTFTVAGDQAGRFPVGIQFTVSDSPANDGTYTVTSVEYQSGRTIIGVAAVPDDTAGGTILTLDDFSAEFGVGSTFTIQSGPLAGVYTVATVDYAAGITTVVTEEALGTTYTILGISSVTFRISGLWAYLFPAGTVFDVADCQGNDGRYVSLGADVDAGQTVITVASVAVVPESHAIAAANEAPTNTFVINGDWRTHFLTGYTFTVTDSTGNDGLYICTDDATFATGQTTIYVASVVDGTDDGTIVETVGGALALKATVAEAASLGGTGYLASLAVFSSKAAIAYRSLRHGHLRYARATQAAPTDASHWAKHTIDDTAAAAEFLSLAVVAGKAVVAYHRGVDLKLKYAYTGEAEPDAEGDWTIQTVHSGTPGLLRGTHCVALTGLLPSIVALGNGKLLWHKSAVASPPSFGSDGQSVLASIVPTALLAAALADVASGAGPVLALVKDSDSGELTFVRPQRFAITVADPGTSKFTIAGDHVARFGSGKVFYVLGSTGNDGAYSSLGAALNAGNTEITVASIPDTTDDGWIALVPEDDTEWETHSIDTDPNAGDYVALGWWGASAVPVAVYANNTDGVLTFALGGEALPNVTGDWTTEVIANERAAFPSVAIVGGHVIVAYYNLDTWDLKVAYRA